MQQLNDPRVIAFDRFFDGGSAITVSPAQTDRQETTQQHYSAVDTDTAKNMRTGIAGLQGVVIPKATAGGTPVGVRPHAVRDMVVTIDPHIHGQAVSLKLGDITAETVMAAEKAAATIVTDSADPNTSRLRSATVMHAIADAINTKSASSDEGKHTALVNTSHQAVVPMTPMPSRPRYTSPLAAFDQRPMTATPMSQQKPQVLQQHHEATVSSPAIEIIFEMEHFGTLKAYYHDVLMHDGFLVLVFDKRHVGSSVYFPPVAKAGAPRLALNIVGTNEVYLTHTTGIQFEHQHQEFCVLLIEQAASMEQ